MRSWLSSSAPGWMTTYQVFVIGAPVELTARPVYNLPAAAKVGSVRISERSEVFSAAVIDQPPSNHPQSPAPYPSRTPASHPPTPSGCACDQAYEVPPRPPARPANPARQGQDQPPR